LQTRDAGSCIQTTPNTTSKNYKAIRQLKPTPRIVLPSGQYKGQYSCYLLMVKNPAWIIIHNTQKILHRQPIISTMTSDLRPFFWSYSERWWQFGLVGNVVGRIKEVNQRRARLVLGWVTVCRRVNHLGV